MSDEQWLNYKQAGELLGITPEAARHRSRRFRWRTRKDNGGKTLILVPLDEAVRTAVERVAHTKPKQPVQSGEINALHDLLNAIREHMAKFEAEREREGTQHQADLQAERERHFTDISWHRSEIERLNKLLERPWWRKIVGT